MNGSTQQAVSNGASAASGNGTLRLEATDVTGTHTLVASDVQKTLPVGAVTRALASRMSLPANVPWALRDESTSVYLDDTRPIGDQIAPGARVTITPKTHLG
jgi:hypothetical protein